MSNSACPARHRKSKQNGKSTFRARTPYDKPSAPEIGILRADPEGFAQIEKEEWLRLTATLRRWLFFGKTTSQPASSDESLGALLARRDQVRAARSAVVEPSQELFRSEDTAADLTSEPRSSGEHAKPAESQPQRTEPEGETTKPPSTAERLLDAKRRAQQRRRPPR